MTLAERLIDDIAQTIIIHTHPEGVTKAQMEQLKNDLALKEKIANALFGVIVENISEEKAEEFEMVLAGGDEKKIQESLVAITATISNIQQLTMNAIIGIEKEIKK